VLFMNKSRGAGDRADIQAAAGLAAAIDRSQAAIEFGLDGTILHANENFLKVTGYTLEEIRGRHHSLFVEAGYKSSDAYRLFWQKLGRGEYDCGQYQRVGKNGRRIWLQATYNPVLDLNGRPRKIIKLAADITAQKTLETESRGVIAAIGRSQAVIEFSLDGTILDANEQFLQTMGYTMDQIRGQHHRMFVEPAYRASAEYADFWARLAHGEYFAGQYLRIARGNRQVWLQASYNPILDASGRPTKVMKFATDITAQKVEARMNAAFKGALDNVTANVMVADMNCDIIYLNSSAQGLMANGQADFRKELPRFDASKLLGTNIDDFHRNPAHQRGLLAALNKTFSSKLKIGGRTMRITANPMRDADGTRLGTVVEWQDLTQEIATETEVHDMVVAAIDGDLERRIDMQGKVGFFQNLSTGINSLVDSIAKLVSGAKAAAGEVAQGASRLSSGTAQLSERTERQASSLEQTASSMEQMTSTVRQNADNASQANQLARAARDQAEQGGAVVTRAVAAMDAINESSRRITDIIGVIDDIAFQTNLLALNAAVEAARAGDQGRGFAVVASEVRNLAGRSATAAKQIKALIQDSGTKVREGSTLVSQSGATLVEIVASVKKVTDIVAEIAAASTEQSSGIDQVNRAVMQLDELTQQNATLVEQASTSCQAMATQARSLDEVLAHYRVGAGAQAVTRVAEARPVPATPPAARRAAKSQAAAEQVAWKEY
jgi:methyl-accepting chemotaxis protein